MESFNESSVVGMARVSHVLLVREGPRVCLNYVLGRVSKQSHTVLEVSADRLQGAESSAFNRTDAKAAHGGRNSVI